MNKPRTAVPSRRALIAGGAGAVAVALLIPRRAKAEEESNDALNLRPLGNGQDDWPQLMTVAASVAYDRPIRMLPGLNGEPWLCKSKRQIPNRTVLIGSPGTRIIQSLTPNGDVLSAALVAGPKPDLSAPTRVTSVAADNVAGTSTIAVAAYVPPDHFIQVLDVTGLRGSIYLVKEVIGSGPYVLTLERPVRYAFVVGDVVQVVLPVRDI